MIHCTKAMKSSRPYLKGRCLNCDYCRNDVEMNITKEIHFRTIITGVPGQLVLLSAVIISCLIMHYSHKEHDRFRDATSNDYCVIGVRRA